MLSCFSSHSASRTVGFSHLLTYSGKVTLKHMVRTQGAANRKRDLLVCALADNSCLQALLDRARATCSSQASSAAHIVQKWLLCYVPDPAAVPTTRISEEEEDKDKRRTKPTGGSWDLSSTPENAPLMSLCAMSCPWTSSGAAPAL